MSRLFFQTTVLAAVAVIFGPAYLADRSDAARLGFFGEDYEGNLCGQHAMLPDGSRGRDLQTRPFVYWMNTTMAVCVRECPRLAGELVCEYPFEAVPTELQRAQLGTRCFAQRRTRPSFPACLPHQPSEAQAVDRWLSQRAVDQLASDTLQASSVILGCWCAAGLAALVALGGLLVAPRLTLFVEMIAALGVALGGAALLLPHGTRVLSLARAPLERHEALYWREEVPGVLQFAVGWAACAAVVLLALNLSGRARHAPLAASMLRTAAQPLLAMPQLLLLPLYLFIAIGVPLSSWITAVVYLAAPCGSIEQCGPLAAASRILWPLSLSAPYWLAASVTAWAYCAVGGAVGNWYAESAAPASARTAKTGMLTPPPSQMPPLPPVAKRWVLWRSGLLAMDAHLGAIGEAAFFLPFVTVLRILVPPAELPPRRFVNPYSRAFLGAIQGCLRLLPTLLASYPETLQLEPAGATLSQSVHPPPTEDEDDGELPALPPSYGELPLTASALAGA